MMPLPDRVDRFPMGLSCVRVIRHQIGNALESLCCLWRPVEGWPDVDAVRMRMRYGGHASGPCCRIGGAQHLTCPMHLCLCTSPALSIACSVAKKARCEQAGGECSTGQHVRSPDSAMAPIYMMQHFV